MAVVLSFRTDAFFDSPAVLAKVGKARIKVLSKFGAFVRTRARSSIRKRKKPSSPGQPPSSHTGTLKRFIFFSYVQESDSVVIGPAITKQSYSGKDGQPVSGTIPSVLENNGAITITEVQYKDGTWKRIDRRKMRSPWYSALPQRTRQVNVQARPFMGPALATEGNKLPGLWADSVK